MREQDSISRHAHELEKVKSLFDFISADGMEEVESGRGEKGNFGKIKEKKRIEGEKELMRHSKIKGVQGKERMKERQPVKEEHDKFLEYYKKEVEKEKERRKTLDQKFMEWKKEREKTSSKRIQGDQKGNIPKESMKREGAWSALAKMRTDPCVCEEWGRREGQQVDISLDIYGDVLWWNVMVRRMLQKRMNGGRGDNFRWRAYKNISLNCMLK